MGNLSCCFRRKQPDPKKTSKHRLQSSFRAHSHPAPPGREVSVNSVPHIIDRLPDEEEESDPSTHPTAKPTFMERSKSENKLRLENLNVFKLCERRDRESGLKRWNSCSTIYLDDSTISQPHLKNNVHCMSWAIYYHILNRKNRGEERLMEIFEERLHPIITRDPAVPEDPNQDPPQRAIYRFIRFLFQNAQLTAECAIITLVYVERLLNYAEIDLCPSNWRRVVLGAIMLASKVWDDQAVWNVDYCQILQNTNVDDMNELERQFLECLEFNINVPSSVYAKYYYALRELSVAQDLFVNVKALSKERARKLEATSQAYEERKLQERGPRLKRTLSMERPTESNSRVVIS